MALKGQFKQAISKMFKMVQNKEFHSPYLLHCSVIFFLVIGQTVSSKVNRSSLLSVCHGKYGCFSIDYPWFSSHRVVNAFPRYCILGICYHCPLAPGIKYWMCTTSTYHYFLALGTKYWVYTTIATQSLVPRNVYKQYLPLLPSPRYQILGVY